MTDFLHQGTSGFMSVETENQKYNFLPRDLPLKIDSAADSERSPERLSPGRSGHESKEKFEIPPFRYNPLHDLESLWWVAVYFVAVKQVIRTGETDPPFDVLETPRQYATKLFTEWETRWVALYYNTLFLEKSRVLPQSTRKVLIALDGLRNVLHNSYFWSAIIK